MIGEVEPERFFQEYLPLFDMIGVPVFILEVTPKEEFVFRKLNQKHTRLSGLEESVVLGKTLHDFLPKRAADTVQRNYLKCLHSGRAYAYEEVLHLPTGETWWSTTLSPLRYEDRIFALFGVSIDITKHKLSEKRIADSLMELHATNQDLELLISMTAHDLRGPLRQAKIVNEMMSEGFEDLGDNKTELLTLNGNIIDKALDQIDGRLETAIVRKDTFKHQESIDFGHYFKDLMALLDPMHKLEAAAPDIFIECEYFILDIALRNLVDNAVKHAESKVTLDISAEDEMLEFSISDNGDGFGWEASQAGQIEDTQPSIDTLSGFGLSTASKLISARGGKLWITQPQLGKGSTIRFSTPGSMRA